MAILHPPTDLEVILIKAPDRVMTDIAAKFCTSSDEITAIVNSEYDPGLVRRVLDYGHGAVSEFDQFVFGIDNVSRVLTHQLVRKRIGVSYAQESQRYVGQGELEVICPTSLKGRFTMFEPDTPVIVSYPNGSTDELQMRITPQFMADLAEHFYHAMISKGVPEEDARFFLPQGCRTKILVSMNARALNEFFAERCCTCAQWEIRHLAKEMLKLAKAATPDLFANAGPKCLQLGYCPENAKRSCGNRPLKSNVIGS